MRWRNSTSPNAIARGARDQTRAFLESTAIVSAYGDKQLDTIIETYADAGRKQPAEYPALPAWQDLPIEMREAFIHVFSAGRRSALEEANSIAKRDRR
jgi:hypothetical protein